MAVIREPPQPAVAGAIGTDDEARRRRFEALFEEVYEPVQRYVRRRAAGAAAVDVDDVVADALFVVWRRPTTSPTMLRCRGRTASPVAVSPNHRRSARRSDRLAARVAAMTTVPHVDGDGDPELDAALAGLGDDDRELLRLWAWEQLTPGEIATALGISPNAAAIRLHRARRRLAGRLGSARKPAAAAGHPSTEHGEEGAG